MDRLITDKIKTTITGAVVLALIGGVGWCFTSLAQVDKNKILIDDNKKIILAYNAEIKEQNKKIDKTSKMVCSLAIILVNDRDKAEKICNPK